MEIQNKKLIIIGSGASGIGAAKLAVSKKAVVSIYDKKSLGQHEQKEKQELENLKSIGVKMLLGVDILNDITGYDLIIKSPGVPMDLPFIVHAKENGVDLIGEFEFASRYCKANIAAITGTNGKTTTTSLVGNITKAYNSDTYIVGNIGRPFSEDVNHIKQDSAVIAEVSSFQLESSVTFHPTISSVLNIEPDHLNRHSTMENYIDIKERIFKNQTPQDFTVLNYDDPNCKLMGVKSKAQVIWFSTIKKMTPGVYVEDGRIIEHIGSEPHIICHINDLKILGGHNVENALAAVAITSIMGIPVATIKEELTAFKGVAHRIEYVGTKKGVDFFNDSKATNPDAAIKGLLAMNKKVRLIVGGLDKDIDFTKWIKLFHGIVERAYVIGETKKQFKETFMAEGFEEYKECETFEEAVHSAYEDSKEGECVLLSPGCASWDMFKNFEERGDLFKEIFHSLKE
ncbi:MAG TPA: UDP-N-acetylmuramoyl-L-alanine--D-glutamate ligase [Epulopiscium sp.]|nr:UDP-N-acetylmuramoyl-L-alanine--D-glutamate ligase [Candidatus Epulonipiscium sp.]